MDIHPPDERIHTWREVCPPRDSYRWIIYCPDARGAGGVDAPPATGHGGARANIRQEITHNAVLTDADLVSLKQDEDRLMNNLAQLAEIQSTHHTEHHTLAFTLRWESFGDSAWKSARDTGALGFMAYNHVQDLSDVYGQQDIVNAAALRLFEDQPKSIAPVFIMSE